MKHKILSVAGLATVLLTIALLSAGCGLNPQFTYQGRLTDENGTPLNGDYSFTFRLYKSDTGGTALYEETKTLTVEDGLFDTEVGPTSIVAGIGTEDLSQPLWLEVEVDTETLTPRQRLYGAPYAFTLMPGAYISTTMSTVIHGASGAKAILNVVNSYDGNDVGGSDPALPALRVVGEQGIEIVNPIGSGASIHSDMSSSSSDLYLYSHDDIELFLDHDANSTGYFRIRNGAGNMVWYVDENGNHTASTYQSEVDAGDKRVSLYTVQSTENWFEDFGAASLKNGEAVVEIELLFAQTVNLSEDYHVFLTPLGDCHGLYVAEKTATSFTVRELGGGTAGIAFDYRLVAKRLGYETARLEPVSANLQADDE
ncbi:MAG: hypothetical protein K8R89_00195 [Anaerolineae bacterium]|nr:hypothetical protein [Anaerolineae bacterium]